MVEIKAIVQTRPSIVYVLDRLPGLRSKMLVKGDHWRECATVSVTHVLLWKQGRWRYQVLVRLVVEGDRLLLLS